MTDVINGTCMEMCPAEERKLREREGLIHRLESLNIHYRRLKADPSRTVKAFSRSAAGQITPKPENLRPGPVLLKTVIHLLRIVSDIDTSRSLEVYDFVCDRLRAVRQDMTIQRLLPDVCIPLLEPMVRFHVFSGYKLASNPKFDVTLNDAQLFESLHRLLSCYEASSAIQPEMQAVYSCLNLKRPESVVKLFTRDCDRVVLNIVKAWSVRNYVKVFLLSKRLPLLARMVLVRHLPEFRKHALQTLCYAFSSANSSYPVSLVALLLSYNSIDDAVLDCNSLGIHCENSLVKFNKRDFQLQNSLKASSQWWVVESDLVATDVFSLLMGRS